MADTFAQDITSFILKTGLRADLVLRKLGFDAYLGLLLRSPVDSGRYRASHRISINKVDSSVEPADFSTGEDPTQGAPSENLQAANQAIANAKIGDSIYLTNNLPYAQPLEDGHSQQAKGPAAVYGNTFNELVTRFARTVRSVR